MEEKVEKEYDASAIQVLEGLEEGDKIISTFTAMSASKASGDPRSNAKVTRKEK